MSTNPTVEELKTKYAALSDAEIKEELLEILAIPNARTNVAALTRMTALLPELEKRGMESPSAASRAKRSAIHQQEESSFSTPTALLGLVLIVGGVALSAGTGRIFYGAVLVGIAMIVKSAL